MTSIEYAFKRMQELMGKAPPGSTTNAREKTNNFDDDFGAAGNDDRSGRLHAPAIADAAMPRSAVGFRMSPLRTGGASLSSSHSGFRSTDPSGSPPDVAAAASAAAVPAFSALSSDVSTPHLSFIDATRSDPAAAGAAASGSRRSASRSVIPHASLAGAPAAAAAVVAGKKAPPEPRRFLTMRELARLNFKRNFNITIRPEDEITLDHTSCSEEEREIAASAQRHRHHSPGVNDDDDDDDSDAVHLDDTLNSDEPADEQRYSLDVEFGTHDGDDGDDENDSDGMSSIKARTASIFAAKKRAFERTRRLTKQRHQEMKKLKKEDKRPAPPSESASKSVSASKRRRVDESDTSGISLGSSDTSVDHDDDGGGDDDDDGSIVCGGTAEVASTLGRMTGCFRCLYGQEEYDSVNNEDMAHLHKLHYENIGKIDPMCIALIMHKFYNETIRPKAVARGQYLPPWRSKSIFVCNMTHNWNPETQIVTHLLDITTVLSCIKNKLSSVPKKRKAGADGGVAADEEDDDELHLKHLAEYNKTLKTLAWFSYLRPEKMVFHNPNQQIKLGDPRVYSRDIVMRVDRSIETNKASRQRLLKAK